MALLKGTSTVQGLALVTGCAEHGLEGQAAGSRASQTAGMQEKVRTTHMIHHAAGKVRQNELLPVDQAPVAIHMRPYREPAEEVGELEHRYPLQGWKDRSWVMDAEEGHTDREERNMVRSRVGLRLDWDEAGSTCKGACSPGEPG